MFIRPVNHLFRICYLNIGLFYVFLFKAESNAACQSPSTNHQSPAPTKKLSRILYEIGSILSFVGIGKDMKQPASHTTTSQTPNIVTNQPLLNPSQSSIAATRRSQFKKHTPTTLSSNSDLAGIDQNHATATPPSIIKPNNLLSPLSPTKTSNSHSLNRLYKSYPHRFKSLTSQSSNALDDEIRVSPAPSIKNLATKPSATIANNTNLLSPTTNYISLSNSNNNLLSTDSRHLQPHHQAMLKQMQKKYSKSVDSTYSDSVNLNDGKFRFNKNSF